MEYIGILASDNELKNATGDEERVSVFINSRDEIQYYIKAISKNPPEHIYTGYINSLKDGAQLQNSLFRNIYNYSKRIDVFREHMEKYAVVFSTKNSVTNNTRNNEENRSDNNWYTKILDAELVERPENMRSEDCYITLPVFSPKSLTQEWEYDKNEKLERAYSTYSEFVQLILTGKTIGRVSRYETRENKKFVLWNDGDKIKAIGPIKDITYTSRDGFILRYETLYDIDISEYDTYFIYPENINPSTIYVPETIYEKILNKLVMQDGTNLLKEESEEPVVEACVAVNEADGIRADVISIDPAMKNDYELLKTFSRICEDNDLYFETKDLNNLHTALKTGKLVILSGMSGTGKSAIVDMYTRALGLDIDEKESRVLTIPVRPAWNDDSDLLGYMDLVHMVYRPSDNGFVKLLVEASKKENKNKLYFVCFDEMNLARVEHYFSQFLSILEKPVGERILRLYDDQYRGRLYNSSDYPDVIELSDNIRFIGTVNIDESTFNFADKVLDRANVITLHILPYNSWKKRTYITKAMQEWTCDEYKMLSISNNKWDSSRLKDFLWEMHLLLQQVSNSMGVGPRVVKSIESYVEMLADEVGEFSLSKEEGVDLQVKQRILTKIRGSSEQCNQLFENEDGNTIEAIFDKYSELSSFEESRKAIAQKKKEIKIYGYCI